MNHPRDLIRLMRPLQWLKNAFVFTGILFGSRWDDPYLLFRVVLVAIAFSLVSSAVYIFNDMFDCENDRHHPVKKKRPLPSGKVSFSYAFALGCILGTAGLLLSYWVSLKVLGIVILYLLLNIVYSYKLKHIVIIDVFCISAGFMLRILAGTVGVGIPPSKWLLLCGLMVTLFLGFAKRRAELLSYSVKREDHHKEDQRKVLINYGPVLLDEIIAICATSVIISYSLYTMSPETVRIHHTENLIYTVPFVIYALFRYIYLLHHGNRGENPSRDLIKDPHIVLSVLAWAVLTFVLIRVL